MEMTHLEQFGEDGYEVQVHRLLGLCHKCPPDVGHSIPHTSVGVILVAVQFGDQACYVGLQLLPCQLCNGRKPALPGVAFSFANSKLAA